MDYNTFIKDISEYYSLYEKGLKKQANKYLEEYAKLIETWDKHVKDKVFFQFAEELCDHNYHGFRERGNGRIPYALDTLMRDYLYSESMENKIPQLRWFYELYRHDRFGGGHAKEMLEKAYAHDQCDKKTVVLLFDFWIEILAWGAHHFPEGCIISKDAMENAVNQCKKIIAEKEVDEKLIMDLQYYERLYDCFFRFEEEGRKREFQEYCDEAKIEFVYCKAYYFKG